MAKTNAAHVSKVLKAAGIPRASAYSTWGYKVDGFVARQDGAEVYVAVTPTHDAGRRMYEAVIVAAEAAGFRVAPRGKPGLGGTYSLMVTR